MNSQEFNDNKTNRAYAYMLKSELDISTEELKEYVEKLTTSTQSVIDYKHKYITISYDSDIKQLLTNYIISIIPSELSDNETDELEDIIYNNIDIFFDISCEDNIYTCEIENM